MFGVYPKVDDIPNLERVLRPAAVHKDGSCFLFQLPFHCFSIFFHANCADRHEDCAIGKSSTVASKSNNRSAINVNITVVRKAGLCDGEQGQQGGN